MSSGAHVVYVHGLWLNGAESALLRRRLERRFGLRTHAFHYPTVSAGMAEIVARLRDFVRTLAPAELHLVGHSLGGLVIYRFLEAFPRQPPGRVVFLGTPSVTCRAAECASRIRWIATLIGKPVAEELLEQRDRRWTLDRELGVIAGTQRLGLGQFFARFDEPNDGTVAVSETRLPGAAAHITLHVSHMGMVIAPAVAEATGRFLLHGRFTPADPRDRARARAAAP